MSGFPDTVLEEVRAPILVLGLGNMLLTDDGVGPALLTQLANSDERWRDQVEFVDGGTQGLALLGQLTGRRALIIVDALKRGAAPGTIHRLTLPELRELSLARATSAHESNAGELLSAAQLLDELPDRLFIVGVEPERIATGIGLSESVQQALSSASDQVNCLLAELC
ncbi:MAG TPA: hydrogenase maturation protease [Candidatus Saccharimonadales bacterium]|nr:hydrogenase maturation protease [Candidatus Saccharimonadales bacterium]